MADPAPTGFEVPTPILNGPFEEPHEHWLIRFGETPQRLTGRRKAGYWYRSPDASEGEERITGEWQELTLVNLIRERMGEWHKAGRPGTTRTTRELIEWWEREGREHRLFFAQREAANRSSFWSKRGRISCKALTFRETNQAPNGRPKASRLFAACAPRWPPVPARPP